MLNIGRCLLAAIVLGLSSCGSDDPPTIENSSTPISGRSQPVDGQAAYEAVCASCHREGIDGAPATGDASAWSGRSQLWMAVLSEHVKTGYLQMPARGGDEAMSDANIEAATEYMLLQTYPDLPRD